MIAGTSEETMSCRASGATLANVSTMIPIPRAARARLHPDERQRVTERGVMLVLEDRLELVRPWAVLSQR
jgi:hypothetical protein